MSNADQRGRQLRQQIFGAEGMKSLETADDFQMPLQDMVTRICFGEGDSVPAVGFTVTASTAILPGKPSTKKSGTPFLSSIWKWCS